MKASSPSSLLRVALLVGAAEACFTQSVATPRGRCDSGPWSEPTPVPATTSGDTLIARYPTVAAGKAGGYVVGNNVRSGSRPISRRRLLLIRSFSGGEVPPPPGDFTFMFPVGVVGHSGQLTLFWGEPRPSLQSGDAVVWLPLQAYGPESIWSATFLPGTGWDTPVRLHQGGVEWNKQLVDRPIVIGGSASIAVAKAASMDGGILVVTAGANAARTRELPTGLASQPSIAELGGTMYVAYIAAYRGNRPDENSVFLIASSDGGASWAPPTLVSRSGLQPANEPRLRTGADGRLHLIWRQQIDGGRSVLRHVISNDRGGTWSIPDDLAPPNAWGAARAAIDRCGRVNVVYENRLEAGSLAIVTWDGKWSEIVRPFAGAPMFDADIAAMDGDELRLVMVTGSANDPESHRSMAAVMRATTIAR